MTWTQTYHHDAAIVSTYLASFAEPLHPYARDGRRADPQQRHCAPPLWRVLAARDQTLRDPAQRRDRQQHGARLREGARRPPRRQRSDPQQPRRLCRHRAGYRQRGPPARHDHRRARGARAATRPAPISTSPAARARSTASSASTRSTPRSTTSSSRRPRCRDILDALDSVWRPAGDHLAHAAHPARGDVRLHAHRDRRLGHQPRRSGPARRYRLDLPVDFPSMRSRPSMAALMSTSRSSRAAPKPSVRSIPQRAAGRHPRRRLPVIEPLNKAGKQSFRVSVPARSSRAPTRSVRRSSRPAAAAT